MTWEGLTPDSAYGLRIESAALRELGRMCGAAGSVETGGILVGRYSPDLAVAIVREATLPPPDSRRGRSWFNRGVAGLREMLAQRWRAKDRTHYLGEWHFHPAGAPNPSGPDIRAMQKLALDEAYNCPSPILLILGGSPKTRWSISATLFRDGHAIHISDELVGRSSSWEYRSTVRPATVHRTGRPGFGPSLRSTTSTTAKLA